MTTQFEDDEPDLFLYGEVVEEARQELADAWAREQGATSRAALYARMFQEARGAAHLERVEVMNNMANVRALLQEQDAALNDLEEALSDALQMLEGRPLRAVRSTRELLTARVRAAVGAAAEVRAAASQAAYDTDSYERYSVTLTGANWMSRRHVVSLSPSQQPPSQQPPTSPGRIARNVNPPATPGRGGPTTPGTPGTPQTQAYLRGTPEVVIPDLLGRPVLRYRGEWVFETP